MHRVWLWVHPIQFLAALYIFIGTLAFAIHFILLSTERYNWLGSRSVTKKAELIVPAKPSILDARVIRLG
jgi:light-harvesting complex 1 alpha chain